MSEGERQVRLDGYLTPYKLGKPVLVGSGRNDAYDRDAVDCPFVFKHNGRYFMMHVGFDGTGYQTALAVSDDLLHWKHHGIILRRGEGNGWDSKNAAGTWMLRENNIHSDPLLKKWSQRYWLAYHSYPGEGYEEGSAKIGLAWTEDPDLLEWHRFAEPILASEDGDEWERGGLYKECLLEHDGTFYLFYNAKNSDEQRWKEQIGLARSHDLKRWERYAGNPVVPVSVDGWDCGFASDPCVLRDENQWVMYYYGFNYKKAEDGIALSGDLLHWEKHPGPILTVGGEGEIDSIFAHKPSVISRNGTLFHFYCASRRFREGDPTTNFGTEFRTISVAASRPWTTS